MKIIYTACKYDYMDASRGYGFEHYNFYDTLSKMPNVEVLYFPYEKMLEVGKEEMNAQLRELVDYEKPDILFAVMFTDQLSKEVIGDISKKTHCKTVAWFCDDHWRFDNYSKYWAPYFNWVVTTDSLAPAKYHHIGHKNVIKSQWACNYFLYKPMDLPKKYDVTFIGQPHGNRKKIIGQVKKAGINVQCWGGGGPNGRVSQTEMINIFSQSKINLNLTKSAGGIGAISLARIFFEKTDGKIKMHGPGLWLDNVKSFLSSKAEQIKGRNFEIPGCNVFLMTGQAPGLEDYYRDGKEIVVFKDTRDLIKKITYYLKHENQREQIALAGYNRTTKEHTYEKRFNDIFKIINLKNE